MELEPWLPPWQPDRILEYPELEGPTGLMQCSCCPTLTPQQSQPLSHRVPPAGSWDAGAGQAFKDVSPKFSAIISNSLNTTENSFSFSCEPHFSHTSHPDESLSRAAAGLGKESLTLRVGFSQYFPVGLHFQAACWALTRTPLLTLLLLTLMPHVFHKSNGRSMRNGAEFHFSWEYFPRECVTKALRMKGFYLDDVNHL